MLQNDEYKTAYYELLKQNTQLHAEKKQLLSSATASLKQADEEIAKLHKIIDTLLADAVSIMRSHLPDSSARTCAEIDIFNLAPLKIGSNGKQK